MPILSNDGLKRDLRNARRVLWWKLVLILCYVALSGLGLSFAGYLTLLSLFSVLIILFSYILFVAFSRLAKHFHTMRLFWFIIADFTIGIFLQAVDTIERFSYYGVEDPNNNFMSGIAILTGAIMTFLYGYYILDLPFKKFGSILFRARVANIGQALLMTFLVYVMATPAHSLLLSFFSGIVGFCNLIMIVVTCAIDFTILGVALRLLGGVLPHLAPTPRR
jgi:hypothetical protein